MAIPRALTFFSAREWRIVVALFVSYVAVALAAWYFLPPGTGIRPAVPIALVALFFGGLRLWPFVYISALAGILLTGGTTVLVIAIPISVTIQAVVGAYLLRRARLDPIFRRYRDMLSLAGTVLVISALLPSAILVENLVRGIPFSVDDWGRYYVAAVFCFLIITPFLLRWITKPWSKRSTWGWLEVLTVFAFLIAISVPFFIFQIPSFLGLPLMYLLLVPLFWIALLQRPRFVTLALFILAIFGVWSTIAHGTPETIPQQLLAMEMFMIVLAAIFLTITSVEEDRRVNTGIMLSQMETLENAVARVSSENSAKNDFIAILAHELRNPLAPVVSAIELMRLKGSRDQEDAETLAMMEERMQIVRRLLDDLLDISRISEGKIALEQAPVDIVEIVQRAVLSTEHHRKEHHQDVVVKKPASSVSVVGDSVRLEQVFSNLLTNAAKYSHSGDTFVISIREDGADVEIEVSDNGVGLEASELERIFKPFEQGAHGKRSMRGLGIGLALVRSFVQMHGGTIEARSAGLGKGASFIVRLPRLAAADMPKPMRKGIASLITPSDSGTHVLIVDDNDAAAGSMGRLLELQGCIVSYAYNGKDAVELGLHLNPHAVLLDVGLPDIDGYEVARRLRAQGFTGVLVALSGYSTHEAKAKGKEAGFDHYLVKPAGLAEIRAVLPKIS